MAAGRNPCVSWRLCCGCVVLFLLLAGTGVVAAGGLQRQRETGVVGSTQELDLRGNPATSPEGVSTELEGRFESFEAFERRELVDSGYPSDPADPNCNNDPTSCPP